MREMLIAVALFASLCSTAIAGPEEDALQIVEKWAKAFTDSDVDVIVKLYAPDAFFWAPAARRSWSIRRRFAGTSSRRS